AAAAITLARAGRDGVLVDKARFPRDKCCGDGLTTGALRLYERLGLDPPSVPSRQRAADAPVGGPTGPDVPLPLPRAQGTSSAVARRVELDDALLAVARAEGAKVLDGHAVTGADQGARGASLDVDGIGTVRARYVVAADGMWSPVRRLLGVGEPGYRGEWHAF